MFGLRISLVVTTIAIMFGTTITGSALAAGSWFVGGTKLGAGSTIALSSTAQVEEYGVLSVPSLAIKLTCAGGSPVIAGKPFIQGPNDGGAENAVFGGCSEITPSGCTIPTEIATEPVVGTLETSTSPGDHLTLAPAKGKLLASVEFKGSCSLAGEKPVNGKVTLAMPSGQAESAMQAVDDIGSTENNSLELGGGKAYLEDGAVLLLLASGAVWSFH
jgi:hypothetical protein